jgi:hypothetical protein
MPPQSARNATSTSTTAPKAAQWRRVDDRNLQRRKCLRAIFSHIGESHSQIRLRRGDTHVDCAQTGLLRCAH